MKFGMEHPFTTENSLMRLERKKNHCEEMLETPLSLGDAKQEK